MSVTLTQTPLLKISPEAFEQLCRSNPDTRLERTANGDLLIMAPAGSESGSFNLGLSAQLWNWTQTHSGIAFDSSAGFTLPNGAIRSPDAAWIRQDRWDKLTPQQKRKFAPICPDFVLELLSLSDELVDIQAKIQEYIENGSELGWLVDPQTRQVEIYRPDQSVEVLQSPATLDGESVMPRLRLNLSFIW